MINFFREDVEVRFVESAVRVWLQSVIESENKKEGEINFIFCDDEYLLGLNQQYLAHDTYTDIISFDNSIGNELHGDVYISVERVLDNAQSYKVKSDEELRRVMVHGVLHFCGYKDKTVEQADEMRYKENQKLKMFHVEH